jgi:hypothetical protein
MCRSRFGNVHLHISRDSPRPSNRTCKTGAWTSTSALIQDKDCPMSCKRRLSFPASGSSVPSETSLDSRDFAQGLGGRGMDHHLDNAESRKGAGALFKRYGLSEPKLALRSQSALTLSTCLMHSDPLAMAPAQWTMAPFANRLLTAIRGNRRVVRAPGISCDGQPCRPPPQSDI